MKNIHMIAHTHWDREWYFTTLDTQVLALKSFKEIFGALEENSKLNYHLDGQSSLMEDYLNLRGKDLNRVKKLIQEKRLFIGPWHTQPDLFNIGCESVFRNLKYGKTYAENMGHSMDVLYLPDTFGASAQLPQITKSFDINNIIIRRGYDDKYMGSVEMNWSALNGDRIKTAAMPFGYSLAHPERGGRHRNFDEQQLYIETFKLLEKIKSISSDENIMGPIGGDQVSIDSDFDKFVEKVNSIGKDNYILSSYEKYMDSINPNNNYEGEFRYPRYSRVHKSITSSRYDIKKINHDVEQFLIREVEPLMAFAKKKGISAPIEMLDKAWKLLLESHAHDSMGGCNSDATNKDVIMRCQQAQQIAHSLFNLIAKTMLHNLEEKDIFILVNGSNEEEITSTGNKIITDKENFKITDFEGKEMKFTINNQEKKQKPRQVLLTPEGEVETGVDEYYYINDIDMTKVEMKPLSYKIFKVSYDCLESDKLSETEIDQIENNLYKIIFEDGKLNLEDKVNNIIIKDFLSFENMSDDGDLYDYSSLRDEKEIIIKDFILKSVKVSNYKKIMNLQAKTRIPVSLKKDRTGRSNETKELIIDFSIVLSDELVRFKVDIDNSILDHRLRVVFNLGINTEFAVADLPFGFIKRENNHSLMNNWEGYTEFPINLEPMQNSVSIYNEDKSFTCFGKGVKEYQLVEDGVAITLFRSVGYIGKNDLHHRPGRASGRVMVAKDGQLQKKLTFEFSIGLNKEIDEKRISQLTERYLNDPLLYQKQELEKEIHRIDNFDIWLEKCEMDTEESLMIFESDLTFSGIDLVEDKVILRLYNPTENQIEISKEIKKRIVNALGKTIKKDKILAYDHINITY
ncbi:MULTISPECIES: glycoside hydrolase family 38 C-terminal domain-containing protein [Psychrilyobacter]|uniref:Glycoside hydrolase family 38 central domain-containing protein n=1 Tax=Psychrilyobacter piezotolerans TaxID=2293438 RepID=A0ABX9KJ32_9FUSO|nr:MULTISPECIES: glycoside hydrolase family 38 C-terminal domain-containing protein [Psychrilyobacter]MCS5420611.1 hypothetical protein [Psychrilyobacter sp. S5]NDI77370.1 hypothetical protein [Psychrilyobacter piezotolerans]RDE63675.1 hypothetical protein DV867_04670 [Psychrilyobacter sp. S5]REI42019.1 hypothetical protein DYH56_04670 [Psychrilyobacter piezotolerans]